MQSLDCFSYVPLCPPPLQSPPLRLNSLLPLLLAPCWQNKDYARAGQGIKERWVYMVRGLGLLSLLPAPVCCITAVRAAEQTKCREARVEVEEIGRTAASIRLN